MLRCPRTGCCRAGDDLPSCNDRHVIGCPEPIQADPVKDVTVRCRQCDRTWSTPMNDLMHGKTLPACQGSTDNCRAVIVTVEASAVGKGKAAK